MQTGEAGQVRLKQEVQPFDPKDARQIVKVGLAPTRLEPGTRVILYEDPTTHAVKSFETVSAAATTDVQAVGDDVVKLRTEITSLKTQYDADVKARDEQIKQLTNQLDRAQKDHATALTNVTKEVEASRADLAQVAALKKRMDAFEKKRPG